MSFLESSHGVANGECEGNPDGIVARDGKWRAQMVMELETRCRLSLRPKTCIYTDPHQPPQCSRSRVTRRWERPLHHIQLVDVGGHVAVLLCSHACAACGMSAKFVDGHNEAAVRAVVQPDALRADHGQPDARCARHPHACARHVGVPLRPWSCRLPGLASTATLWSPVHNISIIISGWVMHICHMWWTYARPSADGSGWWAQTLVRHALDTVRMNLVGSCRMLG